jgi:hypothetical protein
VFLNRIEHLIEAKHRGASTVGVRCFQKHPLIPRILTLKIRLCQSRLP